MIRLLTLSLSFFVLVSALANSLAQTAAPGSQGAAANQANPAPNPPTKTAQYGDWQLICRKPDTQTPQSCELLQTVTVNGQKTPFAQIAIGKPQTSLPTQVTVVVVNNVSFPSSVTILTDEKDKAPTELSWARCMPMGCFASAPLKDDLQKKWIASENQGRVIFKAGNGQDIVMPISFKGLKGALEALAKEK